MPSCHVIENFEYIRNTKLLKVLIHVATKFLFYACSDRMLEKQDEKTQLDHSAAEERRMPHGFPGAPRCNKSKFALVLHLSCQFTFSFFCLVDARLWAARHGLHIAAFFSLQRPARMSAFIETVERV